MKDNKIENKIEQTVNGIKSTIKNGKNESKIEQYNDENGLTHFVSEVKEEKENIITIERKEWIM